MLGAEEEIHEQLTLFDAAPLRTELQPNFSGHETFPFRYAWLPKAIRAIQDRPDVFSADDAMTVLGVGKNMVRSMRHWALATGTAFEDEQARSRTRPLCPSDLGKQLFLTASRMPEGWDPYLEDDGSLWLLHWHLATNPTRATTWYWAFNLWQEPVFTRESMQTALQQFAGNRDWSRVAESTLKNDISCFLRTYLPGKRGPTSTSEDTLDCPLTSLRLLVDIDGERFRFSNGPKSGLSDAVFTYALLDCWSKRHADQRTLSLKEIAHGEGSPGRVFRLDDDAVLAYLDRVELQTDGRLSFDDTAIIRQVSKRADIESAEVLDVYYR